MTRFMVAIHHPDDFMPGSEGQEAMEDIKALNNEMIAKGVRVFVGGMASVSEAVSIRVKAPGNTVVTDGPYMESKEHIGGFWVLECGSRDEAVQWGRKAAVACRAPVEVRPFNSI